MNGALIVRITMVKNAKLSIVKFSQTSEKKTANQPSACDQGRLCI